MTDTPVNDLIINTLTKQQYDAIETKSATELYFVVDEIDSVPTENSDNYITSGAVYTYLNNKTDKVSGATAYNFAALDASGNLIDSGISYSYYLSSETQADWNENDSTSAAYILNKPSLISTLSQQYAMSAYSDSYLALTPDDTFECAFGKLEKAIYDNELIVATALNDISYRISNGEGSGGNTTPVDVSGKADKVSNSISGNFASLDLTGNLVDSGHKHSDYLTSQTQSDWNVTNSSSVAYIKNKPTIPQIPTLSKGTTTGSGNAVTDISVSEHEITLTKGTTFLTQHQSIKTINGNTITGTGNVTISGMPAVTSSDNGKILMVVNGEWALINPAVLYSGSGTPNNAQGNNGDIYVQT